MTPETHGPCWRPLDTLANRLFLMRRELGLSQREAAARAGLSFGEWQSLENGADARAVDRKVARIVKAFDVDRDWLIWGGPLGEVQEQDEVQVQDHSRTRRSADRRQGVPPTTSGYSVGIRRIERRRVALRAGRVALRERPFG